MAMLVLNGLNESLHYEFVISAFHDNELPMKCDVCEQTFPDIHKMMDHRKIHFDYDCFCNKCWQGFFDYLELETHIQVGSTASRHQIRCIFFISIMPISSPNPMFDHLLESSYRDDSYKWPNIGFGEEIKQIQLIEVHFKHLIWSSEV